MHLRAVEIAGFKSFASPVELTFGPGITAMVGPNGSGKSNIAEAVRWVLGEQSLKQLRSQASSDVIFSGSDHRRRASKARVRLTFDNESGRIPLEASQVAISRTITQDGESEYAINGEPVRLIDLQQILTQAGIGPKTYTVISQGMVDRYLTATAPVRRELFDEATGIRSLQIRMTQADRKLLAIVDHAREIQNIIAQLKPQLIVLKRQIDRQTKRERLQKRWQERQALWWHFRWQEKSRHIGQAQAALAEIRAHISQARQDRQRLENALLQAAAHLTPADERQEKLREAQAEFRVAQEHYERTRQRQDELTRSVQQVESESRQAEDTLKQKRAAAVQIDWLKRTRHVLKQCRGVLLKIVNQEDVVPNTVRPLLMSIDTTLSQTDEATSVSLARTILHQLEEPLQAVARLAAIAEERRAQLRALPEVAAPSRERLERLLAQATRATKEDVAFGTRHQADLQDAREAELAAEREGSAAQTAMAQAQQELHHIEEEIRRESGSAWLEKIKRSPLPIDETRDLPSERELHSLSQHISALGEIDPLALKEYEQTKNRHDHLQKQLQDITQAEQNIRRLQENLQEKIKIQFARQFAVIQEAFGRYFRQLFSNPSLNGARSPDGRALLYETEDGIDVTVAPPGKKARPVSLLSGGEKTLTSLALLLAIIEAQRPPFIMLDEVDAALDEANSQRFAKLLQEKSTETQCIIISHNRVTISQADILYGVTMQQDGISKIYSVKLSDIEHSEEIIREQVPI